jgi:tetratricopeptide (TPR) repeat protein
MSKRHTSHVDAPAELGRRLRTARRRAGLTQSELAFPGCSAGYVSRIEAGERIPSLQVLRELASRLGISEAYLAEGMDRDGVSQSPLVDAELALRLGNAESAEELYRRVLEGSTSDRERSMALEGLGHVAVAGGRPRDAVALFEQALPSTDDLPTRPRLAEALGRAYATLGEFAPAIAIFEQCLEHVETTGDPIQYVRFACLLGYALTDSGDHDAAARVVARALHRGREITDPYSRSRLYWSQSRLLLEQGRSDRAERYARKALETLRVTEDTYALGHAHQALAHIYLDLDRPEEAAKELRDGWPLIAATATPLEIAHFQIDQARALAALGKPEAAGRVATVALDRLGDASPVDAGRAYVLVGDIFTALEESARAREMYEQAVKSLEPLGPSRYLIEAYKALARVLKSANRPNDALDLLERAFRVQEQMVRHAA